MVRMVEQGVRAVGGVEHAGDPGAAHPRLPRARQLRVPATTSRRRCLDARADGRARRRFDYMRLAHPPVTFRHEKLKGDERMPAARRYIVEHGLNETVRRRARRPRHHRAGRPLQLADPRAAAARPGRCVRRSRRSRSWCSTSTYPLVPEQIARLLRRQARGAGGRGRPARVHRAGDRRPCCAGATSRRRCTARTCCRRPASTRSRCSRSGLAAFAAGYLPELDHRRRPRAGSTATRAAATRSPRAARPAAARAAAAASASAAPSGRCSRR